jgi:hypothetical protein
LEACFSLNKARSAKKIGQSAHSASSETTGSVFLTQPVDAKSALNAKHTASRTKLASHAQRAEDVPVNFS